VGRIDPRLLRKFQEIVERICYIATVQSWQTGVEGAESGGRCPVIARNLGCVVRNFC
jgi:hypothetical protein